MGTRFLDRREAAPREIGGARRDRTVDLLHAMQALSQLSYGPTEGRELWGSRAAKSNPETAVTSGSSAAD